MSITIFISSTSKDLLAYRATVATALLNAGFHPIDMANFMARPEGAISACLEEVADADLFVGIYAWRYGYIPEDAKVSITEQEFDEAGKLGKPRFCFLVDEEHEWPEEYKEKGIGAQLLREFKARIDITLVRATFTTPEDLAGKVLASLQRWERSNIKYKNVPETKELSVQQRNTFYTSGKIQAGHVNLGGSETHSGTQTYNLNFNETNLNVSEGGTVVQGDQIIQSGDFRGTIINIKTKLNKVTQNVGALTGVSETKRDELIRLIDELQTQLEQVPAQKAKDAEVIAEHLDSLIKELCKKEETHSDTLETMGDRLKKAAKNLREVMPTVLPIATQIVAHILQLASG